jgi:hypothetical protein
MVWFEMLANGRLSLRGLKNYQTRQFEMIQLTPIDTDPLAPIIAQPSNCDMDHTGAPRQRVSIAVHHVSVPNRQCQLRALQLRQQWITAPSPAKIAAY